MLKKVNGKLVCKSCGKESKQNIELKVTKHAKKKEIKVIEDNRPDLPVMHKVCPKCEHKEAYWWLIQTRSADEPPTQFFRCLKCKHVWREYK
jgi:DNA-directed RNA polymerase subunit M